MKKLLSFIILVFVVMGVFAQETKPSSPDFKWVVKFLPVNIPLQSFSLEAERMLNAKNAVTLGIGIPTNASLIGKYGIKSGDVSKAEFGTMHVRAAYRHYTGNSGLPKGFYIEPYLKYQNVKATVSAKFNNDQTDASYPADIKVDFNTLNAGVQLGVQWLIAKRVAVDFYFIGLEGGIVNGNCTGTPSSTSNIADLTNKFEKARTDVSVLKNIFTVTSNNTQVNAKASSTFYPWLRSGISIGIAF
jgi:hypothetical protein